MQQPATAAPFAVVPREVPLIWGGHALVRRFGKPGDPDAKIGESWECWDENVAGGPPYEGRQIAALRQQLGRAFVGELDAGRPFPVLTKFIDAREPLSVQVHPDDAYAQRVEHQANGKTECWYILDAEPGAHLILGWTRDTSRDEYVRRVGDGSLGDILRRVPVKRGDAFYLPAGTVHSIGAGVVLYETQQTSDLTYRIFDWNRVGPDGKPRQLHVERAADVLDYRAGHGGALATLEYRSDGLARTALVADHRFAVELVRCDTQGGTVDLGGMPLIVTALEAGLIFESNGQFLELRPFETGLVPAALSSVAVQTRDGTTAFLAVTPLLGQDAMQRRLVDAGVSHDDAERFLAQFSAHEA
jgi:mannose-6-phosphate isomerase